MSRRIEKVKKAIKDNYLPLGLFFTRNVVGDQMTTVYAKGKVTIDACYAYEYLEIFGLTAEEQEEVRKYYDSLLPDWLEGKEI